MKSLNTSERRKALLCGASLAIVKDWGGAQHCFRAAFTGQWEGYQRNRMRDRPGRRTAAQDTDLNYGIREDLLSEARSLVQTEPVAKRVANQYADYCVGRCNVRWDTGDPNMDALYKQNWKDWMRVCDYRAKHTFPKLMKLAVSSGMTVDGNMFLQKVNAAGTAMINLIEADRVSSSGIFNYDTDNMVGGIGLDPVTRRHLFIRVWERTIYGTFRNPVEIPKNDYLHLFDSPRVDAELGVTAFHAVLNAIRDKKEITAAETAKTKRNSKLALIAKTVTGQAPPNINLFGGDGPVVASGPSIGVETTMDGATAYMFTGGEDIKAHEYNGPGAAFMGQMDFIVRNIALGMNLPFGVVWNMAGLGKPGVLFELEQAARTFAATMDELEAKFIIPIIGWVTSLSIQQKKIPFTQKWYNYRVGRPAYISIDAGRDSKSGIAENLMAMKSATRWYDETGDEFEEQTELCYKEAKFHMDMSKKYGVPVETVRQTTPNGNPNSAGDANKQDQGD